MPILGIIASAITGNLVTNSYESIETVTVSTPVSSITFSSIPATYTHLQIRGFGRSTADTQLDTTFNSDTGANYSHHSLLGYGSGTEASSGANASKVIMEAMTNTASVFAGYIIDILDYANTNKYKTTRNLAGYDSNGAGRVSLNSGNWRNTNAITSITLTARSTTFAEYSQFALYGIKGS
jgi:hypothetical protein